MILPVDVLEVDVLVVDVLELDVLGARLLNDSSLLEKLKSQMGCLTTFRLITVLPKNIEILKKE
jgi:hypothetical protein